MAQKAIICLMSKKSSGDRRWIAAIFVALIGAAVVLITRELRGDSWSDFLATATYSIGWALLTFGALYLLSNQFEEWEWGRPDHDLVAKWNEAKDEDGPEAPLG